MDNKNKIIEFMKDKGELGWKEIYAGLPELKPHVIRATIYLEAKNGTFEKTSRGHWKIKEKTITA